MPSICVSSIPPCRSPQDRWSSGGDQSKPSAAAHNLVIAFGKPKWKVGAARSRTVAVATIAAEVEAVVAQFLIVVHLLIDVGVRIVPSIVCGAVE